MSLSTSTSLTGGTRSSVPPTSLTKSPNALIASLFAITRPEGAPDPIAYWRDRHNSLAAAHDCLPNYSKLEFVANADRFRFRGYLANLYECFSTNWPRYPGVAELGARLASLVQAAEIRMAKQFNTEVDQSPVHIALVARCDAFYVYWLYEGESLRRVYRYASPEQVDAFPQHVEQMTISLALKMAKQPELAPVNDDNLTREEEMELEE